MHTEKMLNKAIKIYGLITDLTNKFYEVTIFVRQ